MVLDTSKGLSPRSGLTYALKYAASYLKQGIGKSKKEAFKINGGKSYFIHSYSTFRRYMGVAKEFVRFAKSLSTNRLDKVGGDLIDKFLADKIKKGYTQKTLKVNLCAMQKFFDATGKHDLSSHLREKFADFYSQASPSSRTMPFDNPVRVIAAIRSEPHRLVAELQYLTGARIGDIKKITVNVQDKTVSILGSKGGRDRVISYSDREDKFQRICELTSIFDNAKKDQGWDNIRRTYYSDLRNAVKSCNEIYTGAHAFRSSYAAERIEELTEQNGLSDQAAERILTEELGHSRVEMARYYLL